MIKLMLATFVMISSVSCGLSSAFAEAYPVGKGKITALCKDGSYSHALRKSGACSKHYGVKTWYGQN